MRYSPTLNLFATVICGILFFFILFIIPSFIWGWVNETNWRMIMVNFINQDSLQAIAGFVTIWFMVKMYKKNED